MLKNQFFIINGAAGVGKDSFVEFVSDYLEEEYQGLSANSVSSVQPAKDAAIILGWDGVTKDSHCRQVLSDLKDLSSKAFDGPFDYMCNIIEDMVAIGDNQNVVFFHIREPEEIQRLASTYNIPTVLVKRNGLEVFDNHADKNVDNYAYDFTILNNDDICALRNIASLFVTELIF